MVLTVWRFVVGTLRQAELAAHLIIYKKSRLLDGLDKEKCTSMQNGTKNRKFTKPLAGLV